MGRRAVPLLLAGVLMLGLRSPASASVDLNGHFIGGIGSVLGFGPFPCTAIDITQTGSAFSVVAQCTVFGPSTFTAAGTINSTSGAFTATGQGTILCTTAGSLTITGTGSPDGYSFSASVVCGFPAAFGGSRCGNGLLDAGEAQVCDDAAASGLPTLTFPRCCTDKCQLASAGTQCGFSLSGVCDALDFCDGAAPTCPELQRPNGTPCDDGDLCTLTSTCSTGTCVPGTLAPAGTNCLPFVDPCVDGLCDSAGGCIISPTTNPCDDEDACTTNDTCNDFSCQGGPPPACDPCETCDSFDGCVAEIQPGCHTPLGPKSSFALKDLSDDTKDKLAWKFANGPATTTGDFGDPVSTNAYTLCVYDNSGSSPSLLVSADAPAGSSWQANSKGFKYMSATGTPDGLQKIDLKSGDSGKAKILVKGAGGNLGLPLTLNALGVPVVVQLKADNGMCWETDFNTAQVSNPISFKAKGGQ